MSSYGGFYKGEKKKQKKEVLERKAAHIQKVNFVPQVEIIKRKKGS